ncbi:PQQ-dependent sugar dehydrogenase [Pseudomonas sp. LJDD11]|uniref:PQQ-dependent sugar dehydrogenase n=1 Tax=Pseudomonas sp. LJDD11 TaxID=2931984 RepID=UPI00211C7764|nr:PQQ-dependent sugar dehydrogenase [Pseudomonas sp. LJDD11]MCQ9423005.1 PQQ-dependent sugar dehydrogenase [Pseudomonas sp. LJDD11]
MTPFLRNLSALLIAALATGAAASLVQTQIVLTEVMQLGVPVAASLRWLSAAEDLARYGPVSLVMAFLVLLPAFSCAHWLARRMSATARLPLLMIAAVVGMGTAFWLMRSVIPMPALAGTRTLSGYALMTLTGVLGAAVFHWLTRRTANRPAPQWQYAALVFACLAIPTSSFIAMLPPADPRPPSMPAEHLQVQTIASGLNRPWSVAVLPDGRLLVTEMGGRLLSVAVKGVVQPVAMNDVPPVLHSGGIIGLMEVAVDPDFERNQTLFLSMGYGEPDANGTRLVRARLVDNRLEDIRVLFSSSPKPGLGNNGGRIAFLADGTLVLTVGDGNTRREEAQNPGNHLGTVVRLDRDGRVPSDNPLVNRPGAAPQVYSLGHRNAQGIAVDPANNELYVTEHGPRGGDEINRVVPAGNYGWPLVTRGIDYPFASVSPFRQLPGFEDPVLVWTPSIAPAGLAIYRGAAFPEWQGDMLVPALKERSLRRVIREQGKIVGQQLLLSDRNERVRDVKVGPDGLIYVLTDGPDGSLLRLAPAGRPG